MHLFGSIEAMDSILSMILGKESLEIIDFASDD